MSLKLYCDLRSPPSRSLYMFLKIINQPFEHKKIDVIKGEHLKDDYTSELKEVPLLEHGGFKIIQSVAIFRYLLKYFPYEDHWYPKNSVKQALVDEYLSWQHHNTSFLSHIFVEKQYIKPLITGQATTPEKIKPFKNRLTDCVDKLEEIWLQQNPYLAGENISIADIFCINDLEQTKLGGFKPEEGRPKLSQWIKRVKNSLKPHYDSVINECNLKL